VRTDNFPDAMSLPIISATNITATQIKIYWDALGADKIGGDPIIYYRLEWDGGDSSLLESNAWTEMTAISNGLVFAYT